MLLVGEDHRAVNRDALANELMGVDTEVEQFEASSKERQCLGKVRSPLVFVDDPAVKSLTHQLGSQG